MDFTTADNILNDAAVELGLKAADIADPFASTDPNIIQLCRLLKRAGRSLVRARDWSQLTQEYTFPTVASTASYALPAGFARMKDNTHWNRTVVNPLDGPADSAQWQELKARSSVGARLRFRVWKNLFYLDPTPTGVEDIYFEYISKYWVMPTGQSAPTTTTPTAITDTLWFDETLLLAAVKLLWKQAHDKDTTSAQNEFNQAWSGVAGADGAAPVLSLTGASEVVLCRGPLPDTGWGL